MIRLDGDLSLTDIKLKMMVGKVSQGDGKTIATFSDIREAATNRTNILRKIIMIPDINGSPVHTETSRFQTLKDFVVQFTGNENLLASATSPSGKEVPAEVIETGPNTYTIRFVPREMGDHLVSLKYRKRHIPGSPFKVYVQVSQRDVTTF